MAEVTWRCERPADGDIKMAAKPEHKDKLEQEGYVCAILHDETWTPAKDDFVEPS